MKSGDIFDKKDFSDLVENVLSIVETLVNERLDRIFSCYYPDLRNREDLYDKFQSMKISEVAKMFNRKDWWVRERIRKGELVQISRGRVSLKSITEYKYNENKKPSQRP